MIIKVIPIIPKNTLDANVLAAALRKEIRKESRAVERELGYPSRRWKHRVDFKIDETNEGANIGTNDKIYTYVDQGTKPHIIKPKKAKVLVFNSKFKAKTKPDSLSSSAGRSEPPKVFAKIVKHPGIKARGFVKLVAVRSRRRFQTAINRAIFNATQKANRG